MTKVKIVFCDVEVEIDSTDANDTQIDISDRAIAILGYLIPERLRFNAAQVPGEEDSGGVPPHPGSQHVMPADVMKAYL